MLPGPRSHVRMALWVVTLLALTLPMKRTGNEKKVLTGKEPEREGADPEAYKRTRVPFRLNNLKKMFTFYPFFFHQVLNLVGLNVSRIRGRLQNVF